MGLGSRSDLKRMENTIGKTKQLPTHVVDAGLSNRERVLMQANIAGGRPTTPGGGKIEDQKINYRESVGSAKVGIDPKTRLGKTVNRLGNLFKKGLKKSAEMGVAGSTLGQIKPDFGSKDINMKGQCRNNTCVTAVRGYHKDAGLSFPDINDNRELDKSLRKGELSKEYKPVRFAKNVRKGDIVNFHEDKKIKGKLFKDRGYHTGIVNKLEDSAPSTYVGSGGTEEKTPTRKIYKKGTLLNPFAKSKTRAIRYYTRRDS
jgi:hypothetical protein